MISQCKPDYNIRVELREVAAYLRTTPETVKAMITTGMPLPGSKKIVKLTATQMSDGVWDVSDDDLDLYQRTFDAAEPGRHPPSWVMRTLLVEAGHSCAICGKQVPLKFHHLVPWAKLTHHDPVYMLAVCGICHDLCENGTIDKKSQEAYKEKVRYGTPDLQRLDVQFQSLMATSAAFPLLGELIVEVESHLQNRPLESDIRTDFTFIDLAEKNVLNRVSQDFFEEFLQTDDIHATKINEFLTAPANSAIKESYLKIVADFKLRLTVYSEQGLSFQYCLLKLRDCLLQQLSHKTPMNVRALTAILSFMYISCDLGRKK